MDLLKTPDPFLLFQLPISYLPSTTLQSLDLNIISDLELLATEQTQSLYSHVFCPQESNRFAQRTLPLWCKQYTTDPIFLQESQQLLMKHDFNTHLLSSDKETNLFNMWHMVRRETNFAEDYHYIDYKWLNWLNHNSKFLQCMSLYNMTSPVLSLFLPVLFIILPFFILKLQGIPISLEKYIEVLKTLFRRHQLGQIFNIAGASFDKLIYIGVSFLFYVMQVYQNITSCRKFYKNMKTVHHQLLSTREFILTTLARMDLFTQTCQTLQLTHYQGFLDNMQEHYKQLKAMADELQHVTPYQLNITKVMQIGYVMKCFYRMYKHDPYHDAVFYAFGFHGYLDNMAGLQKNWQEGRVAPAKFISSQPEKEQKWAQKCKKKNKKNKKKETKFVKAYFPPLMHDNPVKNSHALNKHTLITGPNAAGKTTMLKTILINIILSQQTGLGFYKRATIVPYDQLHCYINIPDTSGRDSLFQAEARRCKDIITTITAQPEQRHFCVFDELYSGTNPYEAIASAHSFLKYLTTYPNVTFLLTTHFIDLCQRLQTDPTMQNYHMQIKQEENGSISYSYKLHKGISDIKGGVKVLRDLDYPSEIINNTEKLIKEIYV